MKSITTKVVVSITTFVLLATLFSNIYVYIFFKEILLEENLEKDMYVLSQHGIQLESFLSEVRYFGQSIILDEKVQQFCKQEEEIPIQEMTNYLNDRINRKIEIHSAALITNGKSYLSSFANDEILNEMIKQPWYSQMIEDSTYSDFSNKHVLKYGYQQPIELVTYRMVIFDSDNPMTKIGELLLHIDLQYINKMTQQWTNNYSTYSLIDNNSILVNNVAEISALKNNSNIIVLNNEKMYQKIKDGYLLYYPVEDSNWNIVSFVSNNSLSGRAKHLLLFFIFFIPLTMLILMWGIYLLIFQIISPIKKLSDGMISFSNGKMDSYVDIQTNDELEILSNNFNFMIDQINIYIENLVENERIQKKVEFDLLISKIQPHFMYNTLNSVIYLARKQDNQDIVDMVTSFIYILQDSMSVHNNVLTDSVLQELRMIKAYIVIQNYRYQDRIKFVYSGVDDDYKIPKNILQPMVENAIFHGIASKNDSGNININFIEIQDRLQIEIVDDGIGMDEQRKKLVEIGGLVSGTKDSVHSIGVRNVLDRLQHLYPDNYQFSIISKINEGTKIIINIPKEKLINE